MANKQFGETLRKLRNDKGYTQQQVADFLGLRNKSTLGSWEVGKSEPDGYTLLKLCKIYDVKDMYLAFGELSPADSNEQNLLSVDEQTIIEKYRLFDERGKRHIRNVIDREYEYFLSQLEKEKTNFLSS